VLNGKVPAANFRDKVVLIGSTAAGVGNDFPTPVSESMAPVVTLAHVVSSILQQNFFMRPYWASLAEGGITLLIALYLILLLPRLGANIGTVVSASALAALLATHFVLMTTAAIWLKLMIPAVFLVTGHGFMTFKRFRVTELLKQRT